MASNPLQASFDRIHDSLYIHTPSAGGQTKRLTSDPDTILFLAWGNAPPKNVVKYTNHYRSIYPHARIILLFTSFADLLLHTPVRQAEPLTPAIKAIRAAGEDSKILVHLFSNGGSYKFREMALAYRRTTGKLMRFDMFILDSAPGLPDFWKSITAFKTQLPKFFLFYYIGALCVYVFMFSRFIWHITTGYKPITEEIWEMLNDPELIDINAKRLYLWSKTDELIDWHDIKLHAGDAKQKGYKVKLVEFPGSRHVAHVVVDKERYWDTITQAWEQDYPEAVVR